jgi:hypothetical protein
MPSGTRNGVRRHERDSRSTRSAKGSTKRSIALGFWAARGLAAPRATSKAVTDAAPGEAFRDSREAQRHRDGNREREIMDFLTR